MLVEAVDEDEFFFPTCSSGLMGRLYSYVLQATTTSVSGGRQGMRVATLLVIVSSLLKSITDTFSLTRHIQVCV